MSASRAIEARLADGHQRDGRAWPDLLRSVSESVANFFMRCAGAAGPAELEFFGVSK